MNYFSIFESYKSLDQVGNDINKLIPSDCQMGGSGDKGIHHHDYLDYYESLLTKFKGNFKLLEIGISEGYSLVTWLKKYKNALITGVDINLDGWKKNELKFKLSNSEKKRLVIFQHDATQHSFLSLIPGNFNVIIDDGSHISKDMIASFKLLFPKLSNGGIYIIEDVHCDGEMIEFINYAKSLIPFAYKFTSFNDCKMMSGRDTIKQKSNYDWRFSIKEIIFHRDIVIFTKESF